MSKDKNKARDARLKIVAYAASAHGLVTGIEGFAPSDARVLVRLEREGLIARQRDHFGWGPNSTVTKYVATPKGREALASASPNPAARSPLCDPRPRAQIERCAQLRRHRMKLADRVHRDERQAVLRELGAIITPVELLGLPERDAQVKVWRAFRLQTGLTDLSWREFRDHFVTSMGQPGHYVVAAA
jgi:DNA-binding MarR family transcriptional regulator